MIKPRDNKLNIVEEIQTDSVNKRLIVISKNELLHYFYLENGRIHSFYVENGDSPLSGSIYIGRVGSVNKGINGYFVYISDKKQVFLPGTALSENTILVNRSFDGKLHESDEVVIQIKKEEYKQKRATATTKLRLGKDLSYEDIVKMSRTMPKYSMLKNGLNYFDNLAKSNIDLSDCQIICADEYSYRLCCSRSTIYKLNNIRLYDDETITLQALYGLKSKFDEITNEKVWLKCGGYLYINPTEAMVVIDINTGKTSGNSREKTILNTNIEAIEEISYQIKARNLSGIIIVDLINSKSPDFNTVLTKHMEDCFGNIKPTPKLEDITKLGLAEITRQKILPDIYEQMNKMDKTILM